MISELLDELFPSRVRWRAWHEEWWADPCPKSPDGHHDCGDEPQYGVRLDLSIHEWWQCIHCGKLPPWKL